MRYDHLPSNAVLSPEGHNYRNKCRIIQSNNVHTVDRNIVPHFKEWELRYIKEWQHQQLWELRNNPSTAVFSCLLEEKDT